MTYKYILINKSNNFEEKYDGFYLSYTQAVDFIKKYSSYIFRYNSDSHILYLNYPLNIYYSSSKINKINDDSKEEDVVSYGYMEVRLTDKYPSVRIGILDII